MLQQRKYDITPRPCLLERLGDMSVEEFRSVAELIDNSIRAFQDAIRNVHQFDQCRIQVTLPTTNHAEVCVTIQNNGPGMSAEELEHAVRPGRISNHASDHL